MVTAKIGSNGNDFAGEADEWVMVGFNFGLSPFQKLDSCVHQKCAKNIDQPVKAVDEGDACEDEKSAKKEGPDDSPE